MSKLGYTLAEVAIDRDQETSVKKADGTIKGKAPSSARCVDNFADVSRNPKEGCCEDELPAVNRLEGAQATMETPSAEASVDAPCASPPAPVAEQHSQVLLADKAVDGSALDQQDDRGERHQTDKVGFEGVWPGRGSINGGKLKWEYSGDIVDLLFTDAHSVCMELDGKRYMGLLMSCDGDSEQGETWKQGDLKWDDGDTWNKEKNSRIRKGLQIPMRTYPQDERFLPHCGCLDGILAHFEGKSS